MPGGTHNSESSTPTYAFCLRIGITMAASAIEGCRNAQSERKLRERRSLRGQMNGHIHPPQLLCDSASSSVCKRGRPPAEGSTCSIAAVPDRQCSMSCGRTALQKGRRRSSSAKRTHFSSIVQSNVLTSRILVSCLLLDLRCYRLSINNATNSMASLLNATHTDSADSTKKYGHHPVVFASRREDASGAAGESDRTGHFGEH